MTTRDKGAGLLKEALGNSKYLSFYWAVGAQLHEACVNWAGLAPGLALVKDGQ